MCGGSCYIRSRSMHLTNLALKPPSNLTVTEVRLTVCDVHQWFWWSIAHDGSIGKYAQWFLAQIFGSWTILATCSYGVHFLLPRQQRKDFASASCEIRWGVHENGYYDILYGIQSNALELVNKAYSVPLLPNRAVEYVFIPSHSILKEIWGGGGGEHHKSLSKGRKLRTHDV